MNVNRFETIQTELKGIQQKLLHIQRQNMVNEDNIIHMKKDIEVIRKTSEVDTGYGKNVYSLRFRLLEKLIILIHVSYIHRYFS